MGLLQYPLCCPTKDPQPQSSHSHQLHSQSSTSSSSLSSQQSLPSVPSFTPPPSLQPQAAHHQLITTLKAHSSSISSLTLHHKFLYSGSSDGEVRSWNADPFALQTSSNDTNSNVVAATSNSAVKALVVLNDKLFSAHQDHKIRVRKISSNNPNQRHKSIATLPTFHDRFTKIFFAKNHVQIRRHVKCTWVHHVDTVSALAISNDNSLLYSASWDGSFKIWRTSDFKCLESVMNAHDDAINALVLCNDGFVYTGSADKKIKVWKKHENAKKHTLLATLQKHKSAVNALALSTDGSLLYSGGCDRSILVWEKDNGGSGEDMVVVGALRGHTKAILCLAAAADLILSGSADKSVRVWRRGVEKSYSCLCVLEGHRKPVKCLVAVGCNSTESGGSDSDSYGSCLVYSGSLDCDIKVWQIQTPLL